MEIEEGLTGSCHGTQAYVQSAPPSRKRPPGMLSWRAMTARGVLPALLCPLLLAPLVARGAELEIPSRDAWLGADKAKHFSASAGLAIVGYTGGALLFDAPAARWVGCAGLALAAGVGKELYDAGRGSFFSFKDLTWDVAGTGTGLLLSWAADRLFFQRRADARTLAPREGGAGLPGGMAFSLAFGPDSPSHPQATGSGGRNTPVLLLLRGGW